MMTPRPQRTLLTTVLSICALAFAGCAEQAAEEPAEESAAEPPTVTATMIDSDWQVTEIDGEVTVEDARPTLQFPEDGRLAGTSGCNRYFSSFEMDGDKVTIGNAGATMMACPEPLMDQERRFFAALSASVSYVISADGELLLADAEGNTRLRALNLPRE